MKLYYSKGACSLVVRILLHEIGIACEFESVNLKTKQTETGGNFLKINPKGSVPALALEVRKSSPKTPSFSNIWRIPTKPRICCRQCRTYGAIASWNGWISLPPIFIRAVAP